MGSDSRWRGEQLAHLPLYVLLVVAIITGIFFVASGLAMSGGFERAWEIMLGLRSPFGQASALGVVLSGLGYLAVPTVIGVAAADVITRFTKRRLLTVPEAADSISEIVKKDLEQTVKEEVARQTQPPAGQAPKR